MSSILLIDKLIHRFSNWESAVILYKIQCIHSIQIDANIQSTQEIIHEQISIDIAGIKSILDVADRNIEIDIDSINHFIHKLFMKYYNIIMSMPDAIKLQNVVVVDEEENKTATIKQVIDSNIEQMNDLKWQIFCQIIENLMNYLFQNELIQSNLIWNDIIKTVIVDNIGVQTKRKIILLCRILISFGSKLIEQCGDKTIIMDCKNILNEFLVNFESANYKRYNGYNDLHTLQDINIVFDFFCRDQHQQQNSKHKKRKRRGRRRKKKNKDNEMNPELKQNDEESVLSRQIEGYYNKTRVKTKERQNKDALLSHIGKLWKKVLFAGLPSLKTQINYKSFDGSKYVHLFGSSATKLDESGADIDLYLTVPNHVSLSLPGEWSLFQRLSEELQTTKYKNNQNGLNVENIFNCTVPIIKIQDGISDIKVDISFGKQIENRLNVELLNEICGYNNDKRIRELIIAIKRWARVRDLNDASRNRLNSFGFVLLGIHYLQYIKILPMLKKIKNGNYGHDMVELMKMKKQDNKTKELCLGDLLIGFFEYYANFNFMECSISLFKLKVLKRNRHYTDLNGRRLKDNNLIFCLEDPIQRNYNSAKNIRNYSANLMHIEFLRSKLILKYGSADFDDLCKSLI